MLGKHSVDGPVAAAALSIAHDLLMHDTDRPQKFDAVTGTRHLTRVAGLASLLVREFDNISSYSLDEWDRQKDKLFR
jgi:hypothetical protein